MDANFSEEQKEYLAGYMQGVMAKKDLGQNSSPESELVYGVEKSRLCKEEKLKLEKSPLDMWPDLVEHSERGKFPQGGDVFRFKAHGLFYVSPAQESLMLRNRIPACELSSVQLTSLAEIASQYGGGYGDITTRGNLQIREIMPKDIINVLTTLADIGLPSRGAGGDNARNITASPLSGVDAHELYDVRALAKSLYHYILNDKEMANLPRKFNFAFDNGGSISVMSATNDVAFMPVRTQENKVYFRVLLGGISGHKTLASDANILVAPNQCVSVAVAMLRVFLENGNRKNRKKARLKYLLEDWGIEKFIAETEKKLTFALEKSPASEFNITSNIIDGAHLGFHKQKQAGLYYVGLNIPVGRLKSAQMKAIANIAEKYGSGNLRLTVFQNLIITDIADKHIEVVTKKIKSLGLSIEANAFSSNLVACTGSAGCKYAQSDTKKDALELSSYLSKHLSIDSPLNIHLTGCPHSCAQHYCGDIGLMGAKTSDGEDAYNITFGGGGGGDNKSLIGREVFWRLSLENVKKILKNILTQYNVQKKENESFHQFINRFEVGEIQEQLNVIN